MVSVTDPRTATDAIISRLTTGTGKNIGDGVAPADGTLPYAVVTPLADGDYDGPMNDWQADVAMEWQVTSVGATRSQAQWMQDKCRDAMLNAAITVPSRAVMKAELAGGGFVERDDDFQPPLFYAVDIFSVLVTPS